MVFEKNWTDASLVLGGRTYNRPTIHHPKCGRCNEESHMTMPVFSSGKEWHLCMDCIAEIVFMRLDVTSTELTLKKGGN